MIGVTGILNSLPATFPLESYENSGNMIHGDAPFKLFDDAYLAINRDWPGYKPGDRFKDFVNESCSHVIITCANVFRANDFGDSMRQRYVKFEEMLKGYNKPILLFGLGVQAKQQDLSKVSFPPEAIAAMRAIEKYAHAVSVRGEFTRSVLEKFGGVEKIFVTGCPSFFSRPEVFQPLKQNLTTLSSAGVSRFAYSGTRLGQVNEQRLILQTIQQNGYLIEPHDRPNYQFYVDVMNNSELATVPSHFDAFLTGSAPVMSRQKLTSFISSRFRTFRDLKPWREFNEEFVDFTFGTRFHVNMASLLSGKPALWLTHDSRTSELAETLHLPSLGLDEASKMTVDEIFEATDYSDLFKSLPETFGIFNQFLDYSGLPVVDLPRMTDADTSSN